MILVFLKGLIVGFSIAAPVGPIGMLCIQRSLKDGFKIGLLTGLGAATADGLYGLIAAFGLTAISSLLMSWQFWMRLIGGFFLVYLGISLLRARHKDRSNSEVVHPSAWRAYAATFFLTLTNPMTILSFVAIFAGVGIGLSGADYLHSFLFVAGVTLGSAVWWIILSGGIAHVLHHRMSPIILHRIDVVSGLIMLSFAMIALWVCIKMVSTH